MVRKLFIFLLVLTVIAFTTPIHAITGQLGGKDSDDNLHWVISDDGELYSPADSTVGTDSYPVDIVYTDEINLNGTSITGTDTINMDLAQTTSRLLVTTGATGTATESLIFIDDNRTGVTADTKEEATLEIDPQGTHAIHVIDGISYFGGVVVAPVGMTLPCQIHAAADTLTISEGSKLHVFDNATEYKLTLPAASTAAGITYRIVVGLAPSGTAYTVGTNAGENLIFGLVTVNGAVVGAQAQDLITFSLDAAVIGDWIDLYCDGVNWYVSGQAFAAAGIVFGVT